GVTLPYIRHKILQTCGVPEFDHESVLVDEVLAYLSPRDGAVYCDGTLGGGGHAEAILRTPGTRVIGIDRDPAAIAAARQRLPGDRVKLIHGELADMPTLLDREVDGVVLDLGVSSPQLDQAERGFSFSHEGPLDMRMDPTRGPTALELMRDLDVDAL